MNFSMSGSDLVEMMGEDFGGDFSMGRSFLRRRVHRAARYARKNPVKTLVAVSALPVLAGNDFRMGASFLSRIARRTSHVVRPLTHSVLNAAQKVPVYGSLVDAARAVVPNAVSSLTSAASSAGAPAPSFTEKPPMSTNMKIGIGVGAAALLGLGIMAVKK